MDVDHRSASQYQIYDRCPLRYKYKYVDGHEEKETIPMQLGIMIHQVLEEYPNDPTKQEERLKEIWHVDTDDESQDYPLFKKAMAMLEKYNTWNDKNKNKIIAVEKEFSLDNTLPIVGRIDRIEQNNQGEYIIVDYKTGKTPMSKDALTRDLQASVYCKAVYELYGQYPIQVTLFYLQTGRAVTVNVNPIMIENAFRRMFDTDLKIEGGLFPANKSYACNFCPHKSYCLVWNERGGFGGVIK